MCMILYVQWFVLLFIDTQIVTVAYIVVLYNLHIVDLGCAVQDVITSDMFVFKVR